MATARVDLQRSRILDAMARVVAERGFEVATVADVVRAAGVSRTTFYEQFASKEACFLEAYRRGVDTVDDRIRAAVHAAGPSGWRVQLRAGIRAYLDALAADPALAWTSLREVHAAGHDALDARADALRRFAARYHATFEQARASDATLREPHPDALFVLCAGTEQLAAERLRERGPGALPELEDVFCVSAEALLLHHDDNSSDLVPDIQGQGARAGPEEA
jgi:AcrR family transcriptional regulator